MCTCSNKPHALVIHCEFAMRPTIIATTLMMVYDCCRVAGRAGGGAGGVGAAARHAARHVAAGHRHRALVHGRHHRILGLRRRTTGQGPAESHRYVVSSRCDTQCVCVCVSWGPDSPPRPFTLPSDPALRRSIQCVKSWGPDSSSPDRSLPPPTPVSYTHLTLPTKRIV